MGPTIGVRVVTVATRDSGQAGISIYDNGVRCYWSAYGSDEALYIRSDNNPLFPNDDMRWTETDTDLFEIYEDARADEDQAEIREMTDTEYSQWDRWYNGVTTKGIEWDGTIDWANQTDKES